MQTYDHITLRDNRRLSFIEYGSPTGQPVLYFHGAPSSALEPLLIGNELFLGNDLRIIAPNRPGMGASDFQRNRGFIDWTKDVISLTNVLGLRKFAVLGISCGGGYAIACAAKIPERITSAVVVSGAWQMNLRQAKEHLRVPYRLFWTVADKLSFLLPLVLTAMRNFSKHSKERTLARYGRLLPSADLEALKQGNRIEILSKNTEEAIKNKKGATWDIRMYVRPWDFELADVHFPISFFHGEDDRNVPLPLVKKIVPSLSRASLVTYRHEGHFSTLYNHFGDVARALHNHQ